MPQFGSSRGGRAAKACNLPAGSELCVSPSGPLQSWRGARLGPRSSQSARAPWWPAIRRAPGGPRNREGGVVIRVPELESLGTAKSSHQKYTRASPRRPPYASAGCTAPLRQVPVLPRVCSRGESWRPKLGGLACQWGPSLLAPSTTGGTTRQLAAPDLHFRVQPNAPPRPGCAGCGPAAGVSARGLDPAKGRTCNRLQRDNADF